ncbi:MAG: tRNA wybutosine-synthesizing 3 family protein [archaeon]
MDFDNQKKQAMNKLLAVDKSRKGDIDKEILPFITVINKQPEYYSTSSCAGRIMLISLSEKKQDVKWLFQSHSNVATHDILDALKDPPDETVWLRMEAPIVHIAVQTIEAADKLLKLANNAGFRRSCLLSMKPRIIVELYFPERMDIPISENRKLLVTEEYIAAVLRHANARIKSSRNKLKKLEKLFIS